jgi:hypothetical protein
LGKDFWFFKQPNLEERSRLSLASGTNNRASFSFS